MRKLSVSWVSRLLKTGHKRNHMTASKKWLVFVQLQRDIEDQSGRST